MEKSITICGDECDSPALMHIKYASGYIYYGLKQYDKAEAEFLASLELSRRVNDHRMELDNIYLLAKISMEENRLRKAERYLSAGDRLIEKKIPFNMEAIKVYSELSELYLRLRKFERASFYQSRYIALRDSVYNEALMTNLMKVESRYLQRENEAKIAAQRNVIWLKEQMVNRQSLFNCLVGLLAISAMASLFFVYRNYELKKNSNVILQHKIRERTQELEFRVTSLSKIISEKELALRRLASTIGETIGTLKGITSTQWPNSSVDASHTYRRMLISLIARLSKAKIGL